MSVKNQVRKNKHKRFAISERVFYGDACAMQHPHFVFARYSVYAFLHPSRSLYFALIIVDSSILHPYNTREFKINAFD